MKFIKTIVVACAFSAVSAYAVEPTKSETTCAQLGEKYQITEEAKERFADLAGACDGVYEVNGALYVHTTAVVRSRRGNNTVRLYLPVTDHTFEVTADKDSRVLIGGRKMHVSSLNRGDEVGIYLSVDKFAYERVTEVALAVADESPEEISVVENTPVEALPTTG